MELKIYGQLLINLVKETILDKLDDRSTVNKEEYLDKLPELKNKGATFVTLNLDGKLRGCIGSLVPHSALFEDITSNAINAAFKDPRFLPLSKEEFEKVKVEISLIGPITPVVYTDFKDLKTKIIPYEHGVILKLGSRQGTFLPQVWEQLPDFDQFMVHLLHKAGIDPETITSLPEIFIYKVEKIEE